MKRKKIPEILYGLVILVGMFAGVDLCLDNMFDFSLLFSHSHKGADVDETVQAVSNDIDMENKDTVNETIEWNGRTYQVFNQEVTWEEAEKLCESVDGHLATIGSKKEQKIIKKLIKKSSLGCTGYWIGGRKDGSKWKWLSGRKFVYKNFDDFGSRGRYLRIKAKDYYWDSVETDGELDQGFICEWDNVEIQEAGVNNENEEEKYDSSEGGIHSYELCVDDCTWNEAFQMAKEKGGYLAHINNRKEYKAILSQIKSEGLDNIQFKIGGRRDGDNHEYYWVNEDNVTYGQILNNPDYWAYDMWLKGEPSFEDSDLDELYIDIYYVSSEDRFVWNDIMDDVLEIAPFFSGKLGYIVEYE